MVAVVVDVVGGVAASAVTAVDAVVDGRDALSAAGGGATETITGTGTISVGSAKGFSAALSAANAEAMAELLIELRYEPLIEPSRVVGGFGNDHRSVGENGRTEKGDGIAVSAE